MRITREVLLKLARDTVNRRVSEERDLLAVYLCGSLLEEEFLLGGATDIDLVFIHADKVSAPREISRLTDEVHLDIAHHEDREYRQTRRLRVHPWLGPALNGCTVMYDPQHFMDFTQASVRGQFDRPDYVLQRSRKQMEIARQIWLSYQSETVEAGPQAVEGYLRAVAHAANAVASLSGPPLTERRFVLKVPARAAAIGRPGLYAGLLGLLGAPNADPDLLGSWIPLWDEAFQAVSPQLAPPRLHPDRRLYYLDAFDAILNSLQPEAVLYPFLRTWTLAVGLLPADSSDRSAWRQGTVRFGIGGDAFFERVAALDAYLDLVEETLEVWARQNGAWIS
jgi:hypothetical protein